MKGSSSIIDREVIELNDFFGLIAGGQKQLRAAEDLAECNALTVRFGLTLTQAQMRTLTTRQFEALANTGRMEFGRGITKMLIEAFCESPYIYQHNYEETMLALLDTFYYFKNESDDRIADDELLALMRHHFDTTCQGSVSYLTGTTLEKLCRGVRDGHEPDDIDLDRHII